MNWGWIKKALNSTLGTKDFKPLDEIVEDGITNLKSNLTSGSLVPLKAARLQDDWITLDLVNEGDGHYTHQQLPSGYYFYQVIGKASGETYKDTVRYLCALAQRIGAQYDGSGSITLYSSNSTIGLSSLSVSGLTMRTYTPVTGGYELGTFDIDSVKVKRIV